MRIAHLSDTHLGYRALPEKRARDGRNQRAVDVEQAFLAAIDQIALAEPDLVIHSGDLFHVPRPSYAAVACAIEGFGRLAARGLPTVLIAGNHDTSALRTFDTVFHVLARAVPGLEIAHSDQQRHLLLGGAAVNLIASRKLRDFYGPTHMMSADRPNLMVLHGLASAIPGFEHNAAPGEEQIADGLFAPDYDYIALGDWHQAQQMRPNAWYAGATERFGWGDAAAAPGWLLADLSTRSVAHQPIPTRPMVDLPALSATDNPTPEVALANVWNILTEANPPADAMVRIRLEDAPDRAWTRAFQRLREGQRFPVWHLATPITLAAASRADAPFPHLGRDLPKLDIGEMFREYVAGRNHPNESFAALLLEKGTAILHAAAERARERSTVDD